MFAIQRKGTQKDKGYFNRPRRDILDLVPVEAKTILSVGCAAGATEDVLKRQGRTVYGIEYNSDWAQQAKGRLDAVFIGDVENIALPFKPGSIDCLIYADVLEHLRAPDLVLQTHSRLLSIRGTIVVSVPNMRFWEVVFDLVLDGDWQYTEAGVLDHTHLRVFTPKTTLRMINKAGFQPLKTARNIRLREHTQRGQKVARLLARSPLRDFVTHQFLVLAQKC